MIAMEQTSTDGSPSSPLHFAQAHTDSDGYPARIHPGGWSKGLTAHKMVSAQLLVHPVRLDMRPIGRGKGAGASLGASAWVGERCAARAREFFACHDAVVAQRLLGGSSVQAGPRASRRNVSAASYSNMANKARPFPRAFAYAHWGLDL